MPVRRSVARDGVLRLVAGVARLVRDVVLDVLDAALGAVSAALGLEPLVVGKRASGFLDAALGFVALATHVCSFHRTRSLLCVPARSSRPTLPPQLAPISVGRRHLVGAVGAPFTGKR